MQFIINDIVYIYLAEIIMFGTVLYYLIRILPMWICLLVFSIPLVLFLIQKNGGKGNWCYWAIQYFFLSYLIFVLQIGGITRILFFLQNPVYFKPSTMTVNLIPFVDLFSDPSQYFANILLFVPFGLLFPFLAPKNRLHSTLLWGIGFSCSIDSCRTLYTLNPPRWLWTWFLLLISFQTLLNILQTFFYLYPLGFCSLFLLRKTVFTLRFYGGSVFLVRLILAEPCIL